MNGALVRVARLRDFPPVEHAAAMVYVVARGHRFGMKMLRRLVGRARMKAILAMPVRWIVSVAGPAGVVVLRAQTEADLLRMVGRDIVEIAPRAHGHLELYCFTSAELRARLFAESQQHALRIVTPVGSA